MLICHKNDSEDNAFFFQFRYIFLNSISCLLSLVYVALIQMTLFSRDLHYGIVKKKDVALMIDGGRMRLF